MLKNIAEKFKSLIKPQGFVTNNPPVIEDVDFTIEAVTEAEKKVTTVSKDEDGHLVSFKTINGENLVECNSSVSVDNGVFTRKCHEQDGELSESLVFAVNSSITVDNCIPSENSYPFTVIDEMGLVSNPATIRTIITCPEKPIIPETPEEPTIQNNNKESGFNPLLVIAGAGIALVGFVGYFLYRGHKKRVANMTSVTELTDSDITSNNKVKIEEEVPSTTKFQSVVQQKSEAGASDIGLEV